MGDERTISTGEADTIEAYAAEFLGAARLDETFTIVAVSDGVVSISGNRREDLIGRPGFDVLHADDHQRAAASLAELGRTGAPSVRGIYRMRFGDDSFNDYAVSAVPVTDSGRPHIVLQFSEVTDALRAREFARDSVDTLRLLGESHDLGTYLERVHLLSARHTQGVNLSISTLDRAVVRTHQRLVNGSFSSTERALELPANVERALAQDRAGPWRAFNRMAIFEPTAAGGLVTSVLRDNEGELLGYVEARRSSATEPNDQEWMVHGMVRQVLTTLLRRVRLDRQLREAAERDLLTGLPNRRRLFHDMGQTRDLAGTTLLLIDLDNFSWINNNLGHAIGDQTIIAFARRLEELCPEEATISRFGGDEFILWSPIEGLDPDGLATALRTSHITPRGTSDRRSTVRCSIGAITIAADESADAAIQRADEAMYVAKRAGGDRIHIVGPK